MKISQRLKAIAHLAENSFRVLDVGSDHGYLPYLLLKNSEVVKVIVADISNESLLKAKGNLETFFDSKTIEERVKFKRADGLKAVRENEVDTVVIAGLGGLLISRILKESEAVRKTVGTFILQPRSNQGSLRRYLMASGFLIEREILARDGKHISEIIVAKNTDQSIKIEDNEIAYELPLKLLDTEDKKLLLEFLNNKKEIEEFVLKEVTESKGTDSIEVIEKMKRLSYIDEMIKMV